MEVRIRYCTVCWGYRSRALEVGEALRTTFGAQVEVARGEPGQFDIYVDGREVVSRSKGAMLRMKLGGLPEVAEVIGVIVNGFAPVGQGPDTRVFAPEDAKRFYDRFGEKQDKQFYERAPLNDLISHADFEHTSSIIELGCGTGRLAARLFEKHLPPMARYAGIDVSTTMVEIASRRLARWSDRATVEQADATTRLAYPDNGFDRFIATYVFDLLPLRSINFVLDEAHRLLRHSGKLCLITSTEGEGIFSGLISRIWKTIYDRRPGLVGGCRPLHLSTMLDRRAWQIEYVHTISSWGICSEIVIANRAT